MASGSAIGKLWRQGTWSAAEVIWRDGRVTDILQLPEDDGVDRFIIPGFVDLHCHGGGGDDVMEASNAVHTVARAHARHGTAAFLATTMTAPLGEIEEALAAVSRAMARQQDDEATILGVHLEGPFISPDQLGAQPPFTIQASIDIMDRLCKLAPIRVVTLAPEADPDGTVAAWLRARGIRVQIGHTLADFDTAALWLRERADGVTHLFNAMGGFHHRSSGCAGAALASASHAELICDLQHTDRGALLAALRAIPNVYAVTDATAASGMADGLYRLGRQLVRKSGDTVCLENGVLAGSCLTMDKAFENLVSVGLSLAGAAMRTSTIPASYVGAPAFGRIAVGEPATFSIADSAGRVAEVVCKGNVHQNR